MARSTEDFNYHEQAEKLAQIVSALQDPTIEIDEATKLHASGLALVRELETYLEHAETVITKHVTDSK